MFGFRRSSKSSTSTPVASEYPDNNNLSRNEHDENNGTDQIGAAQVSNSSTTSAPSTVGDNSDDLDDIVGCTSTFQSYCSEWEKLFMRRDYLKSMKSFAMKGGLRSSRFRSIAWKVYLGVLPEEQTRWIAWSQEWRQQYTDLKNKLIINPRNAEAKDLSINNPLSQEVESPWNQFFLDNELRLTIKQDVIRTHPDVPFFAKDEIHNMMIDILFCFGRQHSVVEYRQGMHELLAPLIFVLHCDHQAFLHACEIESVGQFQPSQRELAKDLLNPEFLEHDAYSLFCQIMQIVESWYVSKEIVPQPNEDSGDLPAAPFSIPQDMNPSNVIVTKLQHIQDDLLKKVDHDLYEHLIKMDIAPQIYGIRWLRLLFGREFPMQDLLILWDAIFADDVMFHLVDYVFVAMLVYLRNALLTSDYPSCLRLLMKYPPIPDIQYFVRKAMKIRDPQEFPNLITYYYKNSVESSLNGHDASSGDFNFVSRKGSVKGGMLAQSFSSLTKIGLKRPGTLGLSASATNAMSKSTSEPMNLITDTAVSPDVVVSHRKGSTVSLSFIDGALMQASRGSNALRQNLSSQSLARLEQDAMSSSMVEHASAASSDGANTSPRAGRFSFFGTRGSRKLSTKAKPQPLAKSQEQEASVPTVSVGNIDATCRRCASELDFHIGTIQKFILRQSSLDESDEILLALAGIKQVRDVLKGVLKPSDMFSNPEANSAHYSRKFQSSSAQSSMAATPLYEVPGGKFYVATPDLLSSDTDINSPEEAVYPEENPVERNAGNNMIVGLTSDHQWTGGHDLDRVRLLMDDRMRAEAVIRAQRKDQRRLNNVPQEVKFQKSLPENCLLDSEVEMVELQKAEDELHQDPTDVQKFQNPRASNGCNSLVSDDTGDVNPSRLSRGANESGNIFLTGHRHTPPCQNVPSDFNDVNESSR